MSHFIVHDRAMLDAIKSCLAGCSLGECCQSEDQLKMSHAVEG